MILGLVWRLFVLDVFVGRSLCIMQATPPSLLKIVQLGFVFDTKDYRVTLRSNCLIFAWLTYSLVTSQRHYLHSKLGMGWILLLIDMNIALSFRNRMNSKWRQLEVMLIDTVRLQLFLPWSLETQVDVVDSE